MIGTEIIFILMGGVGLFLFAMINIEAAVHELAGRSFKLFLKKVVRNRVAAVAGSALMTVVLQGSSLLNLLLLAFVGAGLITLSDAIPLLLGANLGSTLDAWIVAGLGFKMNIDLIAYPAIFLAALFYIFPFPKLKTLSKLFLGFGLFFIGIALMKEGTLRYMDHRGPGFFSGWVQWEASLIGIILTALIQSSLATMTLSLSALHAGVIDLPTAAAIVIGAEVGTTLKLFIGTFDGIPVKKRLALSNLVINLITFLLAYVLLDELLSLITVQLNITDPLIGLVSFQTLINLLSLMLLLPFSKQFASRMEACFIDQDHRSLLFIGKGESGDTETSVEMFHHEAGAFIRLVIAFSRSLMKLEPMADTRSEQEFARKSKFLSVPKEAQYHFLKNLQGELQLYGSVLKLKGVSTAEVTRVEAGIGAARSAMYAAKCMMDVSENIHSMAESSREEKFVVFKTMREEFKQLVLQLSLVEEKESAERPGFIKDIYSIVLKTYDEALKDLYYMAGNGKIKPEDFTLMMNFNREFFTANKALLMAFADYFLSSEEAAVIAEIPGYRS